MKYLISIVIIVFTIFFGIKSYLLFEITKTVKATDNGEYLSSSIMNIPTVNKKGMYQIETDKIQFNSYIDLTEENEFEPIKDVVRFLYEDKTKYRYLLIRNTEMQPSILETINTKDLNDTFKRNFKSDYELLDVCYKLSYEKLNLFTTFDELKIYPVCFILRSTTMHYKKGIYVAELTNAINIIQHGDVDFGTVIIDFYNAKKQFLSVTFADFEQRDINLFLNTVKFK